MAVLRITLGLLAMMVIFTMAEENQDIKSASERIEEANRNIERAVGGPRVVDDIAYPDPENKNADQCTSGSCKWDKSSDGFVYIPYVIANHYSSRELSIIERGLQSFNSISCIRFIRRKSHRDFLHIQSLEGCYSYVGRMYYEQTLSLSRQGCIYHNTVQHELLHALGFHHEQCRNDRDQYIRILWQNITSGLAYAFDKENTLNQGTPYDYNSVMQYHRYAFSDNGYPTMVATPNANAEFGTATEMSQNDITRLNRLYGCK